MDLKEKVVVITGGSQGFGQSLAKAFVESGSTVIISSHDENTLDNTARELSSDSSVADVTSYDDMQNLCKYVIDKYKQIDIWINNAGVQIAPSLIEDADLNKVKHLFDVNFFGYFYGCKVVLPYLKGQNSGMILNINSTAGLEGKPEISAYSSSKFAIRGLTESIRKEVKDTNIKVYAVFPGGMQTEIYREKYPSDIEEYMEVDGVADKVLKNLQSDNPEEDLIIKRPLKQ